MMKKQFKKRLLSMVLCGAMVLSLCPQTAIAKQTDHSAEASVSLDGGSGTDAPQKATPSEIETETPDEENVSGESSAAYAAKELTAPTGVKWDSANVGRGTWDPVEGATGYEVQLFSYSPGGESPYSELITVNGGDTTEYTFDISMLRVVYFFKVRALCGEERGPESESSHTEFDSVNVETVTVSFNTNGGSPEYYEPQEVAVGGKLTKPEDPVKEGYIFEGWLYMPGTMWDFSDPVQYQMTLKAIWESISPDTPTNVAWSSRDTGRATWSPVADAESYTLQLYTNSPQGRSPFGSPVTVPGSETSYTFPIKNLFYVYSFGIKANSANDAASEESFSASTSFNRVNVSHVDVKFDANGGFPSPLATVVTEVGKPLPVDPPAPTKSGYRLVGWSHMPGKMWDFNDPIMSEMTLSAVWEKISSDFWGPLNVEWDDSVVGKATWSAPADATSCILQLYHDGGPSGPYPIGDPVTVGKAEKSYTFPISALHSGGYRFGVKVTAYNGAVSEEVLSSIKVFDKVNTEYVTVSFSVPNGNPSSLAPVQVRTGGRVSEPENVIRSGYRLTGWSFNPSKMWNFRDPVLSDMTLTAIWEPVETDSADTSLLAVIVDSTAGNISSSTISVRLPRGSKIPQDASAIRIATSNAKAVISDLQTDNSGKTWTFTVTAEDGVTSASYTLNVSVISSSSGGGGSSGSGGGGSSSGGSSKPTAVSSTGLPSYVATGNWTQGEGNSWKFTDSNGTAFNNQWAAVVNPYANLAQGQSAYDWFRFDESGSMISGWFLDADGNWYYLNPASDGTQGRMMTGWQWITDADGVTRCYYFNPNSDGTRGKMVTNSTTDGYVLDAEGHWTVNGIVQIR